MKLGIDIGSRTVKAALIDKDTIQTVTREISGPPLIAIRDSLEELCLPQDEELLIAITGSGGQSVSEILNLKKTPEVSAILSAVSTLYPDTGTVLMIGYQRQMYIPFSRIANNQLVTDQPTMNDKCAAGGGSFMEQMSERLQFTNVSEFASISHDYILKGKWLTLSGRCAVFTKSDIVHAFQKGFSREEIAAGIHLAVAANFKATIIKGQPLNDNILFIGGVSLNQAMKIALEKELNLEGKIIVPEYNVTLSAIGAAYKATTAVKVSDLANKIQIHLSRPLEYPVQPPLKPPSTHSNTQEETFTIPKHLAAAGLGVDIGSVSTKADLVAEIDGKDRIIASYYRWTNGNPLESVKDVMAKLQDQVRDLEVDIDQIFAATTGSGRFLTGLLIGADLTPDEITAQATGATIIEPDADCILEIGGEDSKVIKLRKGVLADSKMNKACAAGTGAFLQGIAKRIGLSLEEFGEHALLGKNLPVLDDKCAVFTEQDVIRYLFMGVSADDIAGATCIASVRNFLRTLGIHTLDGKIIFQGAVAFNKGMLAAFETVLGRPVIVPPNPHITGALGAAKLVLKKNPAKSSFRGFQEIIDSEYEASSFVCHSCPNNCEVNRFRNNQKEPWQYFNDRCGRYSEAGSVNEKSKNLPDLFKEYLDLLHECVIDEHKEGQVTIGIPEIMMTNAYLPFFYTFFDQLGFNIKLSGLAGKETVKQGIALSSAEPCFPVKVSIGLVEKTISSGIDYLFLPRIINTEPRKGQTQGQTCVLVQSAPDYLVSTLKLKERGIRYLDPTFHFKEGKTRLSKICLGIGQQFGISKEETDRALEKALSAQADFQEKLHQRGQEVIESLNEDEIAYVVMLRPYSYDPALNMNIGKVIQQQIGALAIPQDFIFKDLDVSDNWPNAYSKSVQDRLALARQIREDKRLRPVVITYFACAPDSFGNDFVIEELGEPCCLLELDEHTSDTGFRTRISAFDNTVSGPKESKEAIKSYNRIYTFSEVKDRKLLIPRASEDAEVLAACFRAYGYDAWPMSPIKDPTLTAARRQIQGDVCLPMLVTTQEQLEAVEEFGDEIAFFVVSSNGPCRLGFYHRRQRLMTEYMGRRNLKYVTLGSGGEYNQLGLDFAIITYTALVAADILKRMRDHARPYEIVAGQSDQIFRKYLEKLMAMIPDLRQNAKKRWLFELSGQFPDFQPEHLWKMRQIIACASIEFQWMPHRKEERPLVGIVGEFFVRIHELSNQDLAKKIESLGGEAWLAPCTEFFAYSNAIDTFLSKERMKMSGFNWSEFGFFLSHWLNGVLVERAEHGLFAATRPFLDGMPDIGAGEVIHNGSRWINPNVGGETICSLGKSVDLQRRGVVAVVNVMPTGCLPSRVVKMLSLGFKRKYGIPFLSVDYNGLLNCDETIETFMAQVMDRFNLLK